MNLQKFICVIPVSRLSLLLLFSLLSVVMQATASATETSRLQNSKQISQQQSASLGQ